MNVTIYTIADIPKDLLQPWLQHLRIFDSANPGCHFKIVANAPDMTTAEIVDVLQVDPPLDFHSIIPRDPT